MRGLERPLIICPTHNEQENIAPLVARVISCGVAVQLLFVDDRGTDATADKVTQQQQQHNNIHLLARQQRAGLASAYLAGFAWGMARDYDCFVTMDADLSHDPTYLPALLQLLNNYDVAVGSRYLAGGGVRDWSWTRQLLSRFGALYARTLLNLQVHDPTSGFVAFRRDALTRLNLDAVRSRGYIFQVELKYRAALAGCSMQETPIIFADRKRGKSKLTLGIALEAALYPWQLRYSRHRS